jgi:hypothetical protein
VGRTGRGDPEHDRDSDGDRHTTCNWHTDRDGHTAPNEYA